MPEADPRLAKRADVPAVLRSKSLSAAWWTSRHDCTKAAAKARDISCAAAAAPTIARNTCRSSLQRWLLAPRPKGVQSLGLLTSSSVERCGCDKVAHHSSLA